MDGGTPQQDWQSKLGTLCGSARKRQGSADIKVTLNRREDSQRLGYGHSKRRSGETLQLTGEPRAIGRSGEWRLAGYLEDRQDRYPYPRSC